MRGLAAGLLLTCALWAEPPSIVQLQPRGTQKGRPFSLTVVGQNLGEGLSVISNLPAAFTPLGDAKEGMANRTATFLVEPKAEWAVGVYTIRLKGSNGLSNVLLFSVGAFPEIAEDESRPGASPHQNDSIERAQALPSGPVTVNGTLEGPGTRHLQDSGEGWREACFRGGGAARGFSHRPGHPRDGRVRKGAGAQRR
jgi:hypothetical protein